MSWLDEVEAAFGVAPEQGFGPPTVDVESAGWLAAVTTARDDLGCGFFDYLTAVDEVDEGYALVVHLARPGVGHVESLLIRTRVPNDAATVACVCAVYAGAGWHERETHEMFGIDFDVDLDPLLLPDGFEGHPLRKEFVLASRVAKAWPGAKEPGESDADSAHSPGRRRIRPPGVPEPGEWGPQDE
ncbi:MAG: NADH-quinone oxidoreductase subunit C [Aeromicrobium sp.]